MVFSLEDMLKVRVTCVHRDLDAVLSSLNSFGAIQVTQSRVAEPGVPRPTFQRISQELIALRSFEKALGIKAAGEGLKEANPGLEKLVAQSGAIRKEYSKVEAAQAALADARATQAFLESQLGSLMPLKGILFSPSLISRTSASRVDFYYARALAGEERLRGAVSGIACQLMFSGKGSSRFVIAAVDKAKLDEFAAKTQGLIGPRIPLPQELSEYSSFSEAIRQTQGKLEAAKREQAGAQEEISRFAAAYGPQVASLVQSLEQEARISELPNKFSRTNHFSFAEGWIQASRFDEFSKAVSAAVGDRCAVERVKTSQVPPTKLKNPPVVRRFEFLVKFFSLPQTGEIDPTALIAVTFPIIFGMILGDVGYGLMGMLLAALIYSKMKGDFFRSISAMMMLSSITTVIFGFVYGEFFGANDIFGYHLTSFIERAGNGIPVLMAASIILGAIHLTMGMLIGIANNLAHKNYAHVWGKMGWLGVEASIFFLGGLLLAPNYITSFLFNISAGTLTDFFLVLFVVGVAVIAKFEGGVALVEIPGLLSNNLSYLRIMALGLSGAILAQIVGTIPVAQSFGALAASISSHSLNPVAILAAFLSLLAFAVLMLLGQALAFGLGMFESSIQTLRLHYVEFFSKFYKGGGLPFTPLRD